jgi:hypothetical protein
MGKIELEALRKRARVYSIEERAARAVVLSQPHRKGSDSLLSGSALGRFCLRRWRNESARQENWDVGERYAQLIDQERISMGLHPRQKAEIETYGIGGMTVAEQHEFRAEARAYLRDAEAAIREVDDRTVRIIRSLAYDDMDLRQDDEGRAYNGMYKLRIHFEAVDRPRRIA